MNANSTPLTPPSDDETVSAEAPKKLSLKRSPSQVRAVVRERLAAGKRCLPQDLRSLGIEGGNGDFNDLVNELRAEVKEAGGDGQARQRDGGEELPTLPIEFRRPDAMMRSAIAAFVARIHGEIQEQAELRIAAFEKSARGRESELVADLEGAREETAENARLLEEARGQIARDSEDRRQLTARIEEHLQHHAVLQQSAADIRGALLVANETLAAAAEEHKTLRLRAEHAENETSSVKTELDYLRRLVDTQVEDLRAQKVEVTLRTREATTLQRMVDGLVETNAALVARLVVLPVSPSGPADRQRRSSSPKEIKAVTSAK
jgi:hypothetical protein